MLEPKIPKHQSKLKGINIKVESFSKNISSPGKGDHLLEDWFWEVTIENHSNPFCTQVGFWGVYVVRSTIEREIKFNHQDNSSTLQLFPGNVPKLLIVKDVTIEDGGVGIALSMLFSNPNGEIFEKIQGLYRYNS